MVGGGGGRLILSQRNPMDYSVLNVLRVERNGGKWGILGAKAGMKDVNTKSHVRFSKRTNLNLPGLGSW